MSDKEEEEWASVLSEEEADKPACEIQHYLNPEERNILIQHGLVLAQLLQSEKFRTFLNMNYDLVADQNTKTLYVVEVPDDVAAKRAMDIMKQVAENAPKVQSASASEAKKLLNDPEFLKKAKEASKKA